MRWRGRAASDSSELVRGDCPGAMPIAANFYSGMAAARYDTLCRLARPLDVISAAAVVSTFPPKEGRGEGGRWRGPVGGAGRDDGTEEDSSDAVTTRSEEGESVDFGRCFVRFGIGDCTADRWWTSSSSSSSLGNPLSRLPAAEAKSARFIAAARLCICSLSSSSRW